MKNIKDFLKVVLAIILVNCFSMRVIGQTGASLKDSLKNQITQDDLIAVLQTLNMEIYKFNVNFSKNKKYNVILYKQEYEYRNKIKEENIWSTTSPFNTFENGKVGYRTLEFIRIITKGENKDYSLNIRMGDFGIPGYPIKIDSIYKNPHFCKPFKLPIECTDGSIIPLILIGSSWETTSRDGTMKARRFCMENEMEPDFSSKAFDEMPHYFIIGIRIEGDN
ncbi:MAG TPA: DUF5041 domain-containing protein [Bacteroidales bacterium]|nr:DUF5041 domain-containing protein [Bacteroidales bacterium]